MKPSFQFLIVIWSMFLNMVLYAYDYIGQREYHLVIFSLAALSIAIVHIYNDVARKK